MKAKLFLKENKYILLVAFLLLFLIGISFYQYFKEHYGYRTYYYQVKEECTNKKNKTSQLCSRFLDNKDSSGHVVSYEYALGNYLEAHDPKKNFEALDAVTLTSEIVENTHFSLLQFLSPLFICIAVVGTIHREFRSGIMYHYSTRMKFQTYFKKCMKKIGLIGLLIPSSLLIVFLLSLLITNGQFHIAESTKNLAVYFDWKYNHFLLYGSMICFIQWILSMCYGLIAFVCCFQNKSSLVSMILGYVFNLIMILIISILFYGLLLNKLFGMTELSEYFNLTGYFFFNQPMNYFVLCGIPILLLVLLFGYVYLNYHKKAKVFLCYEKQMG
ncbi:MAG: hypothetical protein KH135_03155 [Firmicutes bacterium]|nr:hypothetical protein [Bacillota bacterium]